jgi:hypothetical protein
VTSDYVLPASVLNKRTFEEDRLLLFSVKVVRKMGAVLRSDNFVEGAKIVLRSIDLTSELG